MEGMGVYTWQDGRRYEGEYKDDKKHGYGIYTWADLRQYQGAWFRGKQHGLGSYAVPGTESKNGLWEDGKRIEWFDEQQSKQILRGGQDYTKYFHKPESGNYVDPNSQFLRPSGFDQKLNEIKQRFKIT
jgi:hypothetical protein